MSMHISLNIDPSIDAEDEVDKHVQKIRGSENSGFLIDRGVGWAFHRMSAFLRRKAAEIGDRFGSGARKQEDGKATIENL